MLSSSSSQSLLHSLLFLAMASSPPRALRFALHTDQLLLLLLLLAAIAPLSIIIGATPNSIVSLHNAQTEGSAAATCSGDEDVLVFQTSSDLRVPCISTCVITPSSGHEPPSRVIIASPTKNGTYPVILFKHGFVLANCFYSELFTSLASAGYIIVAPQAVTIDTDCTDEIEETANVAQWIPISLAAVLNVALSDANVVPDTSKLVMAGHSRGGKIAFAMALGLASTELSSFSALVTLDPVDGTSTSGALYPPIVAAGCNHTLNQLSIPVLILGTGYGSEGLIPCAPASYGHMAYFNCSSAPIMYHLVASDYGHLDFCTGLPIWISLACKSGSSTEALRDFTTELVVAFLKSAVEGEEGGMEEVIENASIELEEYLVYTQDSERNRILKRQHFSRHSDLV